MASSLGLLASDSDHANSSSELTSDDAIHTSWLSPGFLQKHRKLAPISQFWKSDHRLLRATTSQPRKVTYSHALSHVGLESVLVLGVFLDNLGPFQRLHCHYFIFNTDL